MESDLSREKKCNVKFVSGHLQTLCINLSPPDVSRYELDFPGKQ